MYHHCNDQYCNIIKHAIIILSLFWCKNECWWYVLYSLQSWGGIIFSSTHIEVKAIFCPGQWFMIIFWNMVWGDKKVSFSFQVKLQKLRIKCPLGIKYVIALFFLRLSYHLITFILSTIVHKWGHIRIKLQKRWHNVVY